MIKQLHAKQINKNEKRNAAGGISAPVLDGIEHESPEFADSDIAQARNILALNVITIEVIAYFVNLPD